MCQLHSLLFIPEFCLGRPKFIDIWHYTDPSSSIGLSRAECNFSFSQLFKYDSRKWCNWICTDSLFCDHGAITNMTWWCRWLPWLGLTHGTHRWHIPPWRDLFWGRMDDWSQSGCRKTALYVQWVCCYHTCQCGDPLCCCPISPWIGEHAWHEGSLCTNKTIKGNHLITLFKCNLKKWDQFSWSRKVYWIQLYTDWETWESVSCDIFSFKEDFKKAFPHSDLISYCTALTLREMEQCW